MILFIEGLSYENQLASNYDIWPQHCDNYQKITDHYTKCCDPLIKIVVEENNGGGEWVWLMAN